MPPMSSAAGSAQPSAASGGRTEILLSGSGGQGLILAATVLADAFVGTGKEVVQTQSYGPEARGGASQAAVIVADEEIDYPEVTQADVTLCLSQQAYDKFARGTRPGGIVIYDEQLVTAAPLAGVRLAGLPFARLAEHDLGRVVVANIVAVGALLELTGLAPAEAAQGALRRQLPEKILELNLRALALGRQAAAQGAVDAAAQGALPAV
jgi:2-oxoglutarate ferredoxin oxidoreductase subunit gamma